MLTNSHPCFLNFSIPQLVNCLVQLLYHDPHTFLNAFTTFLKILPTILILDTFNLINIFCLLLSTLRKFDHFSLLTFGLDLKTGISYNLSKALFLASTPIFLTDVFLCRIIILPTFIIYAFLPFLKTIPLTLTLPCTLTSHHHDSLPFGPTPLVIPKVLVAKILMPSVIVFINPKSSLLASFQS